MKKYVWPSLGILVLALAACSQPAADSGEPAKTGGKETVDSTPVVAYADVDAIWKSNCISCHSGEKAKEGIDFTSYDSLMKGGEHGPVIVAGKSEESLVYKAIIGDGAKKMPPGGDGLSPADAEKVKAWIDSGAAK